MTNFYVENRDLVLARLLNNESTTIEFLKVDGTHRTMLATLNPTLLLEKTGVSQGYMPGSVDEKLPSDLIAVYDLESDGFRSFYIQNLIYVEGIDTEA